MVFMSQMFCYGQFVTLIGVSLPFVISNVELPLAIANT